MNNDQYWQAVNEIKKYFGDNGYPKQLEDFMEYFDKFNKYCDCLPTWDAGDLYIQTTNCPVHGYHNHGMQRFPQYIFEQPERSL